MKFGVVLSSCVWLAIAATTYQIEAAVRPTGLDTMEEIRGGQAALNCLDTSRTNCPASSPNCNTAACGDLVGGGFGCPQADKNQSISKTDYPDCTPVAAGSLTCTASIFQCTTKTQRLSGMQLLPCNELCSIRIC